MDLHMIDEEIKRYQDDINRYREKIAYHEKQLKYYQSMREVKYILAYPS
jgi:predicted  nucleic acid-binding Zn-ribbon protein